MRAQTHLFHSFDSLFYSYSCVAHHLESQRLAVAYEKGPIVIYDLRTGTRSHVLEASDWTSRITSIILFTFFIFHFLLQGHYTKSTCLGFSNDAHHLASYSDIECRVLIWKLSSSSISMFLNSTLKPFRNFHIDPQFHMTESNSNQGQGQGQVQEKEKEKEKDWQDVQFLWKSDDLVELITKSGKIAKFSLHQIVDIHQV